ncbi:hypothetical protein C8Q72DRAFT_890308 [Fomitopsis betulina]|nr:hypothetical protein C8Q72DRAFT_890308 [Fomitopsis betulina]
MNTGAYAYLLHRISPHVVQVEMRNMNHKEVVAAYPEWLEALSESWKSGVLHGDINMANMCILEGRDDDGVAMKAGALLALESCISCKRFIPATKPLECNAEADID